MVLEKLNSPIEASGHPLERYRSEYLPVSKNFDRLLGTEMAESGADEALNNVLARYADTILSLGQETGRGEEELRDVVARCASHAFPTLKYYELGSVVRLGGVVQEKRWLSEWIEANYPGSEVGMLAFPDNGGSRLSLEFDVGGVRMPMPIFMDNWGINIGNRQEHQFRLAELTVRQMSKLVAPVSVKMEYLPDGQVDRRKMRVVEDQDYPLALVGRNENEYCSMDDPLALVMSNNDGGRNAYRMSHAFSSIELRCGNERKAWSAITKEGIGQRLLGERKWRVDSGVIREWSYRHYLSMVKKMMTQHALSVTREYRQELQQLDLEEQDSSNRSLHLPMIMLGMFAEQHIIPMQEAVDTRGRRERMMEERTRQKLEQSNYGW